MNEFPAVAHFSWPPTETSGKKQHEHKTTAQQRTVNRKYLHGAARENFCRSADNFDVRPQTAKNHNSRG